MTHPIQPLPIEVVHLITAGEVIDSLAAVVRELAENALDAGATRINVALWSDQWRVRVADNGSGMALSDLQQAALPHRTSKIQLPADLWQIQSLGFRGEALHSLAQLADLEICSRTAKGDAASDAGFRMVFNHQGHPRSIEPMAMAPGTIVTAAQVFETWQSRRQSLPTVAQQVRAIQIVIQHLALCHPQVTWQVEQNDRPWFAVGGSPSAKPLLTQILRVQPSDLQEASVRVETRLEGLDADTNTDTDTDADTLQTSGSDSADRLIPLNTLNTLNTLNLLFGLPDRCHRHRPDWIKVAVNGRMVQLPALEQSVLGAFRRTLPRDRHPVCFLHLRVVPAQVDWNRHPAKAEIYLRDLEQWQIQVKQAIEQALQSSLAQLPDGAAAPRLGQVLKAAEAQGVYGTRRAILGQQQEETGAIPQSPSEQGRQEQGKPDQGKPDQDGQPVMFLKAVAQVHQMYILAEHPAGLWLVEQHIAHERVLYEQLCDRWQMVGLESPLMLGQLSGTQLAQLERLKIDVEPFGEQRWAARSAPEALAKRPDCAEALVELSQGGDLEAALVATACRTAIRNGTVLSLAEMQLLLAQWQQTRHPRTCPHGRPIYLPLEESSLARFFRRHWVIGKSHGV